MKDDNNLPLIPFELKNMSYHAPNFLQKISRHVNENQAF